METKIMRWMTVVTGLVITLIAAGCGSNTSTPTPHKAIGYAVGMNTLLHTADGTTWQAPSAGGYLQEDGIDTLFNDVSAVDDRCAWTVGSTKLGGKVLRTLDGGLTWTKLAPNGPFTPPMQTQGIKAVSRDVAWVVGNISTVALTQDGGQTWQLFTNLGISADEPALFTAVAAIDAQTIWVVGSAYHGGPIGIYTTDGGASWHSMDVSAMTSGKPLLDVSAVDKNTIWVSQEAPGMAVYLSVNGGASFSKAYPSESLGDCFSIIGLSDKIAFAGFENSSFEMTFDSGGSWAQQNIEGRMSILGLTKYGTDIWVAGTYPDGDAQAGDGAILHTSNGGVSWTKQTPSGTPGLTRVSFVGGRK